MVTPPTLTCRLQSLPPILNKQNPKSIPSYSKASWGLFVQLWVTSIFTRHAISPSPLLRQSSSRYAIRAGRNLPDKEFRYLRTVIVTAGVHPRFGSRLAPIPLTFGHWPGISPYISPYGLAGTYVFGKQSLEVFCCALRMNGGGAYPEVTHAVLPSSLTRVISYTLGFSPYLPVSVLVLLPLI